jgi:putative peptidoglycan lipid II flippase
VGSGGSLDLVTDGTSLRVKHGFRHSPVFVFLRAALSFGALSVLAKLVGLLKEVVIASRFGVSHALDIYLMGMVFIAVPVSILVVAMQSTLIPELVDKEEQAAARLLGRTLKFAAAMLVIALPIWLALLPLTIKTIQPAADPTHLDQLHRTCLWLIPYYFFLGINCLLYGALQARRVFWPNALLPGVFHLTILTALTLVSQAEIKVMLAGTAMGTMIETGILFVILRRANLLTIRDTSGAGLLHVMKLALPLMLGGVVFSFAPAIEQMLAYRLGSGAVSLLNYGNKLPSSLSGLLLTAISVVILPHFAELNAHYRWQASRKLFVQSSLALMAFGFLVAMVCLAWAEPMVRVVFERGAFKTGSTREVAELMRVYLLQLPFTMVTVVSYRALTALGDTKTMTFAAVMQVLGAALVGYVLSQSLGVTGIALGTVTMAALVACWLGGVTWWRFGLRMKESG